jgi:hypothetical protein|mmetsp:Transcript_1720/g.3065  ORF Transcript_1720/g.3065 Transcript_1720/m.3065 type:complete len:93 (+) Transcript_1720:78-356(+)
MASSSNNSISSAGLEIAFMIPGKTTWGIPLAPLLYLHRHHLLLNRRRIDGDDRRENIQTRSQKLPGNKPKKEEVVTIDPKKHTFSDSLRFHF